jgi:hypothetical protein
VRYVRSGGWSALTPENNWTPPAVASGKTAGDVQIWASWLGHWPPGATSGQNALTWFSTPLAHPHRCGGSGTPPCGDSRTNARHGIHACLGCGGARLPTRLRFGSFPKTQPT